MSFSYYSPYPVDHTKCGATDSTNYTVLVAFSGTRFKTIANGGHVANANGYDIRPYADTSHSTAYSYELDPGSYSASGGTGLMWVKVPTLSHTADTPIYLFYGDSGLSTDGSSTAAWDSSYLAVYHFGNGTLSLADSTANALTGTGTNTPTLGTGEVGGGLALASASTQYVGLGSTIAPTAITVSAWVKATTFPNAYNTVVARSDGANSFAELFVKSNGTLAVYVRASVGLNYDGTGSHTLSTGTFYHLAYSCDSTAGLNGYVNGTIDSPAGASGNLVTTSAPTRIGSDPATASREWNGVIDEVRVSNVARSIDWLLSDYNNQSSPSTFAVLGTEVPIGGTYKVERHVFERGINRGNLRGLV